MDLLQLGGDLSVSLLFLVRNIYLEVSSHTMEKWEDTVSDLQVSLRVHRSLDEHGAQ